MIEAMACGTPVIAFRSGSTPEVVDDGVTGFLVDDVESAAAAVMRVANLSRAKVRARFDDRFTIERVAEDYLNVYSALPGVRRATRRIAAPQRAQLSALSGVDRRKPISLPGLQRVGPRAGRASRVRLSLSSALRLRGNGRAHLRRRHGWRASNVDLTRGQPQPGERDFVDEARQHRLTKHEAARLRFEA